MSSCGFSGVDSSALRARCECSFLSAVTGNAGVFAGGVPTLGPAHQRPNGGASFLHRIASTKVEGANRMTVRSKPRDELEQAFDKLANETPDSVTRAILWLRTPRARWVRIPLGVFCILASFLWFLPVLGIWLLPLGLLLVAQDVPALRKPVGRMILWLLDRWRRLRKRFTSKRAPN
jgi:hypothetical protein